MKYLPIDSKLFIENRKKFISQLKPNSMAIFNSNDEMPRNGDQNFPFRQNSDMFYLSGIDQEKTILILYPDCPIPKYREILFCVETNETIAVWYGHKYTKDEATAASGIKTIIWLSQFESILHELMVNCSNVYLDSNENLRFSTEVPYREVRFNKWLQEK